MADPINSGDTWAVIRGKFNSLIADVAAAVASVAGKLTASSNLSDLPNKAAARTALELGSMAQQAANAVGINGGTISGVTISGLAAPLSVSDGGTGGTTQSEAQDGLGAGATGKAVFVAATPAIGRSALAVAAEVDTLLKSGNFAGLADVDASLGNLGFSTFVRSLRGAADQAALRSALGLGGMAVKNDVSFADLVAAAIVTAAEGLLTNDNDTSLPSCAAVIRGRGYTWLTPQVTNSGSNFDFGIPDWATEIIVVLDQYRVSGGTTGVQARVAGAAVAAGYQSASGTTDGDAVNTNSSNASFVLFPSTATFGIIATMLLQKIPGSNVWVSTHNGTRRGSGDATIFGGGRVSLAGVLDGVRLAVSGGTANQGSVTVGYR